MGNRYRIVHTPAGYVGYVASSRGLRRVYLPQPSPDDVLRQIATDEPSTVEDPDLLERLATSLKLYLAGEAVEFDAPMDFEDAPGFHRLVWERCMQIPHGKTMSYQELATAVRNPRAARAVGNAMRSNRMPIVIPCHRVLHAGGSLGGYSGPGGTTFKRMLLDLEAAAAARI